MEKKKKDDISGMSYFPGDPNLYYYLWVNTDNDFLFFRSPKVAICNCSPFFLPSRRVFQTHIKLKYFNVYSFLET